MADASNHEVLSVETFRGRFPFVDGFLRSARPGQTALFPRRVRGFRARAGLSRPRRL